MSQNINTKLYDSVLDRSAMVRLYEQRTSEKVEVILNGHKVRLDTLISKSRNFKQFQGLLDKELTKTFKDTYQVSKRSLLDLANDQVSYAYQNLEANVSEVWRTKRPARRVSEDIVLKKPLHKDTTLAMGWGGIQNSEKKRLELVIRKGIADGKPFDVIARDVRKGNVHKITRNQSKALVVTATTSVYAQADYAVYAANEKCLEGWQYVSVLDSRTTPICSHRDGVIYPMGDTAHLPPAHYHCRSTTTPIVKKYDDLAKLEGIAQVRKRNLKKLSAEQIAYYDGQTPLKESYNGWLLRQPRNVQYRHLGDEAKVDIFRRGQITVDKFTNDMGHSLGIRELRKATDSGYTPPGDTRKFTMAKERLDALHLGASSPDDFITDAKLTNRLREYYTLQSRELDGTLSLTNYRGNLVHTKRATKKRVLGSLPTDKQMKFNPVTSRYEDTRLFQPAPSVLQNNLRLMKESTVLRAADIDFIEKFDRSLINSMSVNERAVIVDNLRVIFTRYRKDPNSPWSNFKAVAQAQIKFDVMNVSDAIETQLRKDGNLLKRLMDSNYIDPVLGATQLDELSRNFVKNIKAKNHWEDNTAAKIAKDLRGVFDLEIPFVLRSRISEKEMEAFYLKFANRLSLADSPDFDALSVSLGRDLFELSNKTGTRTQWFNTGKKLLESPRAKKLYELETFGVQKRRMKSRVSGQLFGPYYDTFSHNVRIIDPRIAKYSKLTRKVELGLRVSVTDPKNRLVFREGNKTYFIRGPLGGYYDTRIPITSTSSFRDFPDEFIDKNMVKALNWAAKAEYRVDEDFYDFVQKLLYFKDDKGKSALFDSLNEYRHYLVSRGDTYERFKAMDWLRNSGKSFSNHPFIDHRARIYDRGLIGPQSGETFRPFLNTKESKILGVQGFKNFEDQVGAFLGGLDDVFEGRFNGLSITGRQKIAAKWRPELVKIGNQMISAKPRDIRAILQNPTVARVEGEELGKFFRFAIESAKIDRHLSGSYTNTSLSKMENYVTSLAIEQDASSSGAQIIALTTRNKRLAELSNVVPTRQKRRLYDEIAAATYNDPRFRKLNQKLNLTEKDLRKAAKAQNMVTFYGAGERTGIMNVEGKLSNILGKDTNTLVVRASERDTVLAEISARIARYDRFDKESADLLKQLRSDVRDVFNKGIDPGDDMMEQLYFLDAETRQLVEKMTKSYERIVTPTDFKTIASIMSDHLAEEVPILKSFTKYFGRLAEDYLVHAKPSSSKFDWRSIGKQSIRGDRTKGYTLPDTLSRFLGIKPGTSVSEDVLKRIGLWNPNSTLTDIIYGVKAPEIRRTGTKLFSFKTTLPNLDFKDLLKQQYLRKETVAEIEFLSANEMPKSWTRVPWVNFDGKTIEQGFTQTFEERLTYKNKLGEWVTNIVQVPQKTTTTWWDEALNSSGKINDIADATKARTAFAVNGNHSNDAVIVKRFHMWGADNNVPTSTIHDAFFGNAADMLKAREALRDIYANMLESNVILDTLKEMRARGLPLDVYNKYLNEAIETGLIPVVGRSRIDGKLMRKDDILLRGDILKDVPDGFLNDLGFYGVG
jgi:SPP1 gp7 family putative phage head morphogenesis protein